MNPRRRLWLRNQAKKTNEVVTTIHEEDNTIEEIVHQAIAEEIVPEVKVQAKTVSTKKNRTTRKRTTSKKK